MIKQLLSISVLGVLFGWALLACSSGSGGQDSDLSAQGLDSRPQNTSCVAPDSGITLATSYNLTAAFPELLALQSLIKLVQRPTSDGIDDSQWYALLQSGQIVRFANNPSVSSTSNVLDIRDRVTAGGERGLLGIAFHPNSASNRQVYLSYTTGGGNLKSRISRFSMSTDFNTIDPTSETIILEVDQPFTNHNGGNIEFGPDGFLYIGLGDGGSGGDPQNHGQNTSTLLGNMLRIDVDGEAPYSIPADNPFVGVDGADEIAISGLRNPWRWSFDRLTNALWIADVGQNEYEEVNQANLGDNLGWNTMEGAHCYNAETCDQTGLTLPVAEYDHSQGCSVTGGYVYRGHNIPGLQGRFVYGDFCSGIIWGTTDTGGTNSGTVLLDSSLNISSFAETSSGELLLLNLNGDAGMGIYRLTTSTPNSNTGGPAQRLSDTGCVSVTSPRTAHPSTLPYATGSRLWSDHAVKYRAAALPDSTQAESVADGDLDFPVGSVLVKHFELNNTLIETRLYMHHLDGWTGYSYEWLNDQSDAILLADGKDKAVNGPNGSQIWHYPSRAECDQCHTQAAGKSLGLEALQLNSDYTYASTSRNANQLSTLAAIEVITEPPADAFDQSLVSLNDSNFDKIIRARSYLHSNCSQCHRPDGGNSNMDMRFSTAFADMQLCNVNPQSGNLGNMNAKRLVPGSADDSLLIERMKRLDEHRMPPLASNLVHNEAVELLSDWVNALNNCS